MPAPPEIIELVERFQENLAAYTSGTYNETQLRRSPRPGRTTSGRICSAGSTLPIAGSTCWSMTSMTLRRKRSGLWRKIDRNMLLLDDCTVLNHERSRLSETGAILCKSIRTMKGT